MHFDQIIGLRSLSIYLFLMARLNLDLQMDRLPVQASQETLCLEKEREREREREGCLNGVGTYMPGTVLHGCRLFKRCQNLPARTGFGGCRLFKRCLKLPARHFVAGVQAVSAVLEPTCQALCCWGAGCLRDVGTYLPGTVMQGCRLFKQCLNLSAEHCVAGAQAV